MPVPVLVPIPIPILNAFHTKRLPHRGAEPRNRRVDVLEWRSRKRRPEEEGVVLNVMLGGEPAPAHNERAVLDAGEEDLFLNVIDGHGRRERVAAPVYAHPVLDSVSV
jgi:hypothetical protein